MLLQRWLLNDKVSFFFLHLKIPENLDSGQFWLSGFAGHIHEIGVIEPSQLYFELILAEEKRKSRTQKTTE